jgi:hypothetical protein
MSETLRARWSKRERDILYSYPRHGSEGAILHHHFSILRDPELRVADYYRPAGKTLIEELEARGYDITTLKFSIKLKASSASRTGEGAGEPEGEGR